MSIELLNSAKQSRIDGSVYLVVDSSSPLVLLGWRIRNILLHQRRSQVIERRGHVGVGLVHAVEFPTHFEALLVHPNGLVQALPVASGSGAH